MQLNLITVGTKTPNWLQLGFNKYQKRLPRELALNLVEIAPEKNGKTLNPEKIKQLEGKRIIKTLDKLPSTVIALAVNAKAWSTESLAKEMQNWMQSGNNVSLLIGGAEGLSTECLARADASRSLSNLTLPHYMVRVLMAEQLYRTWSYLHNHPYHRK